MSVWHCLRYSGANCPNNVNFSWQWSCCYGELKMNRGIVKPGSYIYILWCVNELFYSPATSHLAWDFRVRLWSQKGSTYLTNRSISTGIVSVKLSACQWQKQALLVDRTLTVGVAPKDYAAAIAAVSAEAIYWTRSKTFGKYESFTN